MTPRQCGKASTSKSTSGRHSCANDEVPAHRAGPLRHREHLAQIGVRFGREARDRYRALLTAAIDHLAEDPVRLGTRQRHELGEGVRSWHVRLSRESSVKARVRHPRHIIIYRVDGDVVVIGRVPHDAMEFERHIEEDETWT